jgi:hypothetical protein
MQVLTTVPSVVMTQIPSQHLSGWLPTHGPLLGVRCGGYTCLKPAFIYHHPEASEQNIIVLDWKNKRENTAESSRDGKERNSMALTS